MVVPLLRLSRPYHILSSLLRLLAFAKKRRSMSRLSPRSHSSCNGAYRSAEMKWFFIDGFGVGVTFESLADSGGERFMSLDLKLSTSPGKI
eukprot:2807893-Heterocapsa_arctica.AAC.1